MSFLNKTENSIPEEPTTKMPQRIANKIKNDQENESFATSSEEQKSNIDDEYISEDNSFNRNDNNSSNMSETAY